jgi:membrane protein
VNAKNLVQHVLRNRSAAMVVESGTAWWNDQAPSKGAALAYYAMFSIAPLLFLIIAMAGLFFGAEAVRGVVFEQVAALMGQNGAEAIQEMLAHVSGPKTGGLAAVVSGAVLLFGASTVFGQLQTALDTIWRVPEEEKKKETQYGVIVFLKARLLSFGLILGLGFLVTISLVLSAALSALGKWWGPMFGQWEALAHLVEEAVSFGALMLIFAAIYKLMPRARIEWRDVWVGAVATALLFTIGKFLIGLYLGKSNIGSSFGAFGSLVIVMVWVYYSAQIFLFGAEFTWVYAHKRGSRREESAHKEGIASSPAHSPAPVVVRVAVPTPVPDSAGLMRKHAFKAAVAAAFLGGAVLRRVIR